VVTRRRLYWPTAVLFTFISLVLVAVVVALAGRGDPAQPAVCATYQAPDGTWMEEDNEPVDGDPCDLDDLLEPVVIPPNVSKKPSPKASPTKPSAPLGGRKKRF
jgi:hypothetical protein